MRQSLRNYTLGGLLIVLFALPRTGQAQVPSRRVGPEQQKTQKTPGEGLPTLTLPAVDAASLLAEDEREAALGRPFRFGVKQEADIQLRRDGQQQPMGNFMRIRYRIRATGAYSVNLLFDSFRLTEGAELTLFNADSTFIIGPITARHNPQNGQFWSDLLPGSEVILELREPVSTLSPSAIHLSGVVHGYKNTFPLGTNKAFGSAGSCEKNVVCYPTYQTEADGVAMILLADGTRWCTGSLMNAINQQFRSFFLTAFHCVDSNNNGTLEAGEKTAAQNWLFRFGYQSPDCATSVDNVSFMTMNGSDVRAGRSESDFLLLELRQQIAAIINPTYLGWDRSNALPSAMVGIHHPAGDVKKISFATGTATLGDFNQSTGTTHLQVQWGDLGVTEPGSSGSPVFNANRKVVGQLHGGPSYCGAPLPSRYDLYGRLATSWNGGTSPETRLRDWLDPTNLFATASSAKPQISGPATLTGLGTFLLNAGSGSTINWTISGPAGVDLSKVISVTAGTGATASLSALASAASLTITFGITAGQTYPIQFSQPFEVTGPKVAGPLALEQPLYDCATHQLRLQASGGADTPIEYMVVGVRRWETDPVVVLPDAMVADSETKSVTVFSRQLNGTKPPTLSNRTFNFKEGCPTETTR